MKRLSSERLFDTRLFANVMRRRMAHMLVAFLSAFFTLAVPLMIALQDAAEWTAYSADVLLARQMDAMQGTMMLNLVFVFPLGIYFGVVAMSYMMKRRSAYFWHALPQKRETLYVTSLAASLGCAALGSLVGIAAALVVLGANGVAASVLGSFFVYLLKNILWFLVAFAVTVFAGSFSGSGVIQTLMSLVVMAYPVAAYGGLLLLRGLYSSYYMQDYYFNLPIVAWLSPVYYAAVHFDDGFAVFPTVCACIAILALLVGALCIYRRRAVENAEKPIVFARLGSVLKYLMVFIVTVYVGLFFEAVSGGGWIFFGFACGGVLSFLLANTVLAKSPKAMLRGFRGLLVFAVVFALFFAVWSVDVFHTIRRVPEAEDVTAAEVRISRIDKNTTVTDRETIEALCTLVESQMAADRAPLQRTPAGDNGGFFLEVVLHKKFGIPVARSLYVYKSTDGAVEFLRAYANSGVLDTLFAPGDELAAAGDRTARAEVDLGDATATLDFDFTAFWQIYRRELGALCYGRLSAPPVGRVNIWKIIADNSKSMYNERRQLWTDLPLYADMTDTLAFLREAADSTGAVFTSAYGTLTGATVLRAVATETPEAERAEPMAAERVLCLSYQDVDYGTAGYPSVTLTAAEAEALLPCLVRNYVPLSSIFVEIDTEYFAILNYERPLDSEEQLKYDMEATESTRRCDFAAGFVPENIKNALK